MPNIHRLAVCGLLFAAGLMAAETKGICPPAAFRSASWELLELVRLKTAAGGSFGSFNTTSSSDSLSHMLVTNR
jgi:hypothetical protein